MAEGKALQIPQPLAATQRIPRTATPGKKGKGGKKPPPQTFWGG